MNLSINLVTLSSDFDYGFFVGARWAGINVPEIASNRLRFFFTAVLNVYTE